MAVDRLWWGQGLSAPGAVKALLAACGKVQIWEAHQDGGRLEGSDPSLLTPRISSYR